MKKILKIVFTLVIFVSLFIPVFGIYAAVSLDSSSLDSESSRLNYTSTTPQFSENSNITLSACATVRGLSGIICQIQQILNSIVPVLIALGVVYFVWGVVQYVIADGEEAKKKGKDRIIYGIIGFAVIVSLWGLVNIVVNTFGLSGATAPSISVVSTQSGGNCSGINNNPKFQDVLCYITGIINNSVIPLIFAVATVMFVWGVVQFFIINADEEAKRAQGKQFMIWGIVALAVMLSVWGLVGILGATFGVGTSVLPKVTPQ